ncbi:MAG TPA: transglutaminase-like domain-containing protein [Terriglobales bacterium]|jgi:transglutaminase-like putative cysteine protease|nr:transglutaminase-like domain-containing protein [Terriglobales bacterium]
MPRRSPLALLLVASLLPALAQTAPSQKERHFTFHYAFTVKNVSPGERVRVWIPLAHSDAYQDVKVAAKSGDLQLKQIRQPDYGNEVLYAETSKADRAEYKFSVDYDVIRREHVVLVNGKPVAEARVTTVPHVELARFLEPDRLVPVTGLPAQLAAQETKDATTQLEKAKDIYEYVFRTMKYDKSGTGWGHGDTLWACDSKHGNCTDFHSVFISMARAEKIPARFQIGFPLPADKHSAEIPGYHCWAEFYLDSTGWVPVDISEAWKHQEMHDYFFGAHDVNRMQFTQGRDLKLAPAQDGPPLNYFIYPYVEIGAKEYPNVSIMFSFEDAGGSPTKVSALR